MMARESVSVILPTYNEKGNIVALIREIDRLLEGAGHEIIVVDDNSPDGTYGAVTGARLPRTNAILRTESKGLARSIYCGIKQARGEILIVMDSDFNHQPRYLPLMIDEMSRHDCVSASRYVGDGRMNSLWRHWASGLFNRFINATTGGAVRDNLYGYFAIRKDVLAALDLDGIFIGYGDYCIRLFHALQAQGVAIHEIPAVNGERRAGRGNRRLVKTFFQYIETVLRLAYRGTS